jgi:hypothetical protein
VAAVYDIVVLVEQPVTHWDAHQITALHNDAPDVVHYHVLMPVEDAASRVEATIGSLAASEVMGTAALYLDETDIERVHEEIREASERALAQSIQAFIEAGARASGEVTAIDPLDRLAALVTERNSAEVVILTRPHLVAELLHIDWTHRARRRLDVPCLHLIAQSEPDWEAQTGNGETGEPEQPT